MRAVGATDKPAPRTEERDGADPEHARKSERQVWVPEERDFRLVPVFAGHRLRFGNRLPGPAVVEQSNTTLFVSASFDMAVERDGLLPGLPPRPGGRVAGSAETRFAMIDPILASRLRPRLQVPHG